MYPSRCLALSIVTSPSKCPGTFYLGDLFRRRNEAKCVLGKDVNLPGTKRFTSEIFVADGQPSGENLRNCFYAIAAPFQKICLMSSVQKPLFVLVVITSNLVTRFAG